MADDSCMRKPAAGVDTGRKHVSGADRPNFQAVASGWAFTEFCSMPSTNEPASSVNLLLRICWLRNQSAGRRSRRAAGEKVARTRPRLLGSEPDLALHGGGNTSAPRMCRRKTCL